MPSSGYAGSGRAPPSSNSVAVQSGENTGRPLTWRGSIPAYQRSTAGTRIPPSCSEDLLPESGHWYENRSPPLSLAKKTRVSSS